jgi:uncharacterized protein with HEPN domain
LSRSDDQRVADIVEAGEHLAAIVADGRWSFDRDWMRQRAAERLLEVIGEASNALSDMFRSEHPGVAWRHIVNLRHLLAHHYHRIDLDQLWTIATADVPAMIEQLVGSIDDLSD